MLALAALALSVRVLIPTGWMPSVEAGRPTITLCTGSGMAEAWIDADGKIHKSSPGKGDNSSGFCAFSTFVLAFASMGKWLPSAEGWQLRRLQPEAPRT